MFLHLENFLHFVKIKKDEKTTAILAVFLFQLELID